MHRVLWVALLGSAAAVSYMARAEASAPDHQAPSLPATVADWARGARLFDGVGRYHRAVTTSSAAAQPYFDQGMWLLWAFNHDESTRSFAKAAQLDPSCAACFWGVALTVGPNYNYGATPELRAAVAWEALHEAQQNAARASAVERSEERRVGKEWRSRWSPY